MSGLRQETRAVQRSADGVLRSRGPPRRVDSTEPRRVPTMHSPLKKPPGRRSRGRTIALWAGVAVGGVLPMIGCQAEYAGMTLPSGKYMYDDVQYFPPGPDFPWANTQAATQRARMQAMGMDVSAMPVPGQGGAPLGTQPPGQGAPSPRQNAGLGPTDINVQPLPPEPAPDANAPGGNAPAPPAPAPDADIPAPNGGINP